MYDIVGDIYGDASRLEQLLGCVGNVQDAESWHHPARQIMFVGDFMDRGPEDIETYRLARSMIHRSAALAALAVMGTHEFNEVSFKTRHAERAGERLRLHIEWNRNQYAEMIEWFKTLPLYLNLDGLRVVHARWPGTPPRDAEPLAG